LRFVDCVTFAPRAVHWPVWPAWRRAGIVSAVNLEDTGTRAAPRSGAADDEGEGRASMITQIKKALVTSRLTFGDADAGRDPYGRDPYNSGSAQRAATLWRQRNRY
jgi:hypothetical protein